MIDPHASVASAEQDFWVEFAEVMGKNLLRFAMMPAKQGDPPLTPEECCRLIELAAAVRAFHMGSLSFDLEMTAQRDKFAHTCGG
jgi:hypothetical protein